MHRNKFFLLLVLTCFISFGQNRVQNAINIGLAQAVPPCSDIYDEGDSLDPCDETATSNWSALSGGSGTVLTETDSDGGSFSIEATVPSNFSSGLTITLPALTNGATYTIEARGKSSSLAGYLYITGGFTGNFGFGSWASSSYTNGSSTGKVGNGSPVVIRITNDYDSSTTTVAWIKITKTADP